MISKSIEGYCEMWDGIHRNTIFIYEIPLYNGKLDFMWYTNGILNSLSVPWDDLIKMVGGKIYLTLEDYKKDKFVDLNDWKNDETK